MSTPARPALTPTAVGPGSDETVAVRAGGFHGRCVPSWVAPLFDERGLRLAEWTASGQATVVKTGPHRTVFHVRLPAGGIFVKRYRVTGWLDRLLHLMRKSRAELEWDAARTVAAVGIRTFEPLAWGVIRRGPFIESSWLATREIRETTPLDSFVLSAVAEAASFGHAVRRRLAVALGTMVGTLHRAGLVHRDLHAGNVLLRLASDTTVGDATAAPELWLIDLHAVSRVGRLSPRAVRRNLALLHNFFHGRATATDRLVFFEAWSIARFGADIPPDRDAARAIDAHCRASMHRLFRDADAKWRRGNRRLIVADDRRRRCRGLAFLGRPQLEALRDSDAPDVAESIRSLVVFPPPPSFYGRLQQRLMGGIARRVWETGHALLRRRIAAVRPVAFAEPRDGRSAGWALIERPPGSVTLAEFVASQSANDQRRDSLPAERIARLVRRLHALGFAHRDLTASHVLVDDARAPLLDGLEHVAQVGPVCPQRAVAQLSRLVGSFASPRDVPPAIRLRFLRSYLGGERRSEWKTWWHAIGEAVEGRPPAATDPAIPSTEDRHPPASHGRTAPREWDDGPRRGAARAPSAIARLLLVAALLLPGCHLGGSKPVVMRPTRHSVRSEQLLILSDFKLSKDHAVIKDLIQLRGQVAETLDLQFDSREVTVYLFSNQLTYRQYLDASYPGLPDRRAYFVGTPKELAVYTFWGERIQEDLRHEYTHGLLHSTLKAVPLWLDEGLAEYFEVIGPKPGTINAEYATGLTAALANGWRPDLQRLERIEEFSQMQRFDYQEAWAWTHYLLHASPEGRDTLLAFLQDLKTNARPEPLSARLKREVPEIQTRLAAYVATLSTIRAIADAEANARH